MEELVVDVSAGDAAVSENVVTVSDGDAVELVAPVVPEVPEVNEDAPVQTYETVVDISPLVSAVETQTAEMKEGFVVIVMLLGIIIGMIFMKGFWTSRG